MNNVIEIAEKIRQQYNAGPYPRTPLEASPKNNTKLLYFHNFSIAYYSRNQKFIETEGKIILDAGCGSGYMALVLAEANPGAKIVGVDISEASVELAQQRLKHHGFENTEFHVASIEDLPKLGIEFDYINCDEVLYLLPDPSAGLQAMKSVLKPDGIIRANLHSALQRVLYFRAQEVFQMMGMTDGNPEDLEVELVREMMKALKDNVRLKALTWNSKMETDDERILMNYLLQGDKGFTIPEMFSIIRAAELEFISMVNWRQWKLSELFKEPDNLPAFLAMSLPEATVEEQLHLFELLNPAHRLLDFWCGHPNQGQPVVPIADWTRTDWQAAKVHIVPQLKTPEVKADLIKCIRQLSQFELGMHLTVTDEPLLIENMTAACLLPLWEAAQSMQALVSRWQQLRPLNPVNLEPTTAEAAWAILIDTMITLESLGYVFLERC
ncbi:SAM-dependent methyltransferase [Chroococcidiopsis sp. CCALA 051]|uniref:methyltransferase domain-containing protein n=1 Tax=Chroococcidiopsis sp. CCALA 051 TaxID=869949 RepID=UPI000D0DC6DF|nr:methyltransferase domain-containing protein [Chroococcidiopsis sp. CCALA 051]PSM49853.1 SAM-dependent methyltransferase [Chroococcidiopsis sp. CCALA 051]